MQNLQQLKMVDIQRKGASPHELAADNQEGKPALLGQVTETGS